MRVVITGGAGFIGSNLARFWLSRNPDDRVDVVDALTYAGRRESIVDLEEHNAFRFIRADVRDEQALGRVLPGCDLVIHLAAESHNDRGIIDPLRFVSTNVLGTATLLEAARRADIPRFHHVSTDEVYGSLSLRDAQRFNERSPYEPRGPYSASKAGSDHLVRAWHVTYGLRATISNCGNNFGPFQYPEKLIPYSIARLLRGKTVRLYGDGRNVRDWVFVEDHCAAIAAIAERGRPGATYLVSADSEYSNIEIANKLLSLLRLPSDRVDFIPDRPGHDRRYGLDSTLLRTELGWRPAHTFDEALRQTVDWYRSNESWWGPIFDRQEMVG